jgi:hypothetical protein
MKVKKIKFNKIKNKLQMNKIKPIIIEFSKSFNLLVKLIKRKINKNIKKVKKKMKKNIKINF